jgi:hypothetical protein
MTAATEQFAEQAFSPAVPIEIIGATAVIADKKQREVTYIDEKDAVTGEQALFINSFGALKDLSTAAGMLGLSGLANELRDQVAIAEAKDPNEDFEPVRYKGQGAVAVHRVLEDGAHQSINFDPELLEPQMPKALADRMYALNKSTEPRLNRKSALAEEMKEIGEEQNRKAEAALAVLATRKTAAWDPKAFHDTDPNVMAAHKAKAAEEPTMAGIGISKL